MQPQGAGNSQAHDFFLFPGVLPQPLVRRLRGRRRRRLLLLLLRVRDEGRAEGVREQSARRDAADRLDELCLGQRAHVGLEEVQIPKLAVGIGRLCHGGAAVSAFEKVVEAPAESNIFMRIFFLSRIKRNMAETLSV